MFRTPYAFGWESLASAPRSAGLTVSQTLYNGQQTANRTRAAQSQVSGTREGLRVLEQSVLLSAATIWYLRDAATVEVQKSNVRVLEETLKQTGDRFNVGEVTRTDVAQSEAQLAAGRTQERSSASSRTIWCRSHRSTAIFTTQQGAIELSLIENPNVTAAMYGIDVSFLQVKINEGALLPTVTFQTSVNNPTSRP